MLGSVPDDALPVYRGEKKRSPIKLDASPTARALLTLELVQSSPGITADRLAGELRVTERAARRYVAILREAGIPIESSRGPFGGYRLGRGVRLPPLTFSAEEALALVMAVLDGHHEANSTDPVGAALAKIVRALPEPVAAQVEAVRRTTSPAPDRSAARPDPATTTALVQACSRHHRVRLGYRSEAGWESTMEVDPWAVVVRHGRWYLLCRSHRNGERRAYRVDRVRGVETLADTFDPPADLDPVAMLEDHLAVGWEYGVEVVIEASIDDVSRSLPRALGRIEELADGTTRLVGSTSNPWWYAEQLAGIPVPYRILGCPEMRHAADVVGRRMVAAAQPEPVLAGSAPHGSDPEQSDPAPLGGDPEGVGPGPRAGLADHGGQVVPHRSLGKVEPAGDLGEGAAVRGSRQDVPLAAGER